MSPDATEAIEPQLAPQHPVFRSRPLRAIFSFPVVLATLLIVLTVFTARSRFNDPDMWWHLKTGEIIWNTHSIPTVDVFSYTTHNHPYTPHEWLSQVTIYGAYKLAGYSGLMCWLCILGSLLLIGSYALCSLYSGNAKVAFLGALATWLFATVGLSIRPQMIGYVLLVCELLILHLGRTRNARWFLILPPLFAIWVNCHASFFLGMIVLGVMIGCSFIDVRLGLLVSERWEAGRSKMLALAAALSIVALLANPLGFKQLLYPINTMLHQNIGLTVVSEWLPLSWGDPRQLALLVVAALVLLLPLLRFKDLYLHELLLLAAGLYLALPHARMLVVFGILVPPILSRLLADAWEQYEPSRDRPLINAGLIALAAVISFAGFPGRDDLQTQVEKGNPVDAVNYIRWAKLSGNMLNQYVYGGYLIWALPEHKVFVDGRSDVYEWTGVLEQFQKWSVLESDPRDLLRRYNVGFCLLPRDVPMSRVLGFLPGWKRVYTDESAVVFVRADAANTSTKGLQTPVHPVSTAVDRGGVRE